MCWTLDASDVHAARATRKEATAALRTLTDCVETIGAAELVIGELLSNAARHTDGKVCLEIGRHDGHAEISVYDSSTRFPTEVKPQPDDTAENGRGLYIISKIARRIAVQPFDGIGKRVSVTLDLPCDERCAGFAPCGRPWLRHDSGVCFAPRVARYDDAHSQLGA